MLKFSPFAAMLFKQQKTQSVKMLKLSTAFFRTHQLTQILCGTWQNPSNCFLRLTLHILHKVGVKPAVAKLSISAP
nr:MAG TPA: hypothetical protein [Caudoviricetes sp.]